MQFSRTSGGIQDGRQQCSQMTDAGDNGTSGQPDELDVFQEFARANPERCVQITPERKASLLKKLESAYSSDAPGSPPVDD